MLHPHTELRFINDRTGRGLVATRRIPRGTIIWAADELDQIISFKRFRKLPTGLRHMIDQYAYLDEGGFVLCWDNAKYMNHSCEPNCLGGGYNFELAVRDIEVGDELTGDYGAMNPDTVFECRCELPQCRHKILPDDLVSHSARWDQQVWVAFQLIQAVQQPLWERVDPWERKHIGKVLAGKKRMISCLENYLGPQPKLQALYAELD